MKIAKLQTYILEHKLKKPLLWANRGISKRSLLLVEATSDRGISGWGECHLAVEAVAKTIDTLIKPLLIGRAVLDLEQNWALMFNRTLRFGQKGIAICAIGAVDMALWDLSGKLLNLPLYQMLGGKRFDKVVPYATGFYFPEDREYSIAFTKEAETYLAEGFQAMKMKVGLGVERDKENVNAVRRVIGDDVRLMVDATWAYDIHSAKILGRHLEQKGVYWFEEPLPPAQLDGYTELSRTLDIAIAGIESEYTAHSFKRILEQRAVDIVQPDLVTVGGITECRKIGTLAHLFGIPTVLHSWSSAVSLAAGLHFICSLPPLTPSVYEEPPMFEYDRTENPFRDVLQMEPIRYENGYLWLPEGPGIGIEIDRQQLQKYKIS